MFEVQAKQSSADESHFLSKKSRMTELMPAETNYTQPKIIEGDFFEKAAISASRPMTCRACRHLRQAV